MRERASSGRTGIRSRFATTSAAIGLLIALLIIIGIFSAISGPQVAPESTSGVLRRDDGILALITCNEAGIGSAEIASGSPSNPGSTLWSASLVPGSEALLIVPLIPKLDGYAIEHRSTGVTDSAVVTAMEDGNNKFLAIAAFRFSGEQIGKGQVQTIDGVVLDEHEFNTQPACKKAHRG